MTSDLKFFVPGIPKTAGSKKAFYVKKLGRAIITDDCKESKAWRSVVSGFAMEAMTGRDLFSGPVEVIFEFHMLRPRGHFGSKGLRKSAPGYPITRPDVLKCARAVEDSLTGLAFHDDSQIVLETLRKVYAERMPGVWITIRTLNGVGNYAENITGQPKLFETPEAVSL